jgi:hypothetical protein
MKKVNLELKALYNTYLRKHLSPETSLEIASEFVLDLINVFGDNLEAGTAPKDGWRQFAPFEFILELNNMLARYKEKGLDGLEDVERSLLVDNSLLLGSLSRAALAGHPDTFPGEEHYQIPQAVADDLDHFAEADAGWP